MIRKKIILFITFLFISSCLPLKKEKVRLIFSKSDEERRDKGLPKVSSISFKNDRFLISGENLLGVKSIKVTGNDLNHKLNINKTDSYEVEASPKGFLELLTGGLTYIFLIENSYGQTPFLVSVRFPDNSISNEKIKDGSINGEKLKKGSINSSKLSSMGAKDGDYLRWDSKNKTWEPTPLNSIQFRGVWNVENSPDSPSEDKEVGQVGDFFIVSKSGNSNIIKENESWYEGDWIISDGDKWKRINNSGKITSVFGRSGSIEPTYGDYSWDQINKEESKISDIGDVGDLIPADGQVLTWNQDEEKWLPSDLKIKNEDIQDNSITNDKIQNNAISTEKVSDLSISSNKILDESITNEKLASNSVTSEKIADGSIIDEDINDGANIKRSKLESDPSSPGHILVNDESGKISSIEVLDIERGGTGASSISAAQSNLGLRPGRDVQKYSDRLTEISKIQLKENTLIGSDGSKIVLKEASEIRNILNLGNIQDFYISEEGNIGIGTTMPSEKLEVNGNINLRGNLFMNSFNITGLGTPEKDTDAVNKAWAEKQIGNIQSHLFYNHQISEIQEVQKDKNLPMNGIDKLGSKNIDEFIERKDNVLKVNGRGLYKFSFKANCTNSQSSQMTSIELMIKKKDSSSWEALAKSKTFGNTIILAETIFEVSSSNDFALIKVINKSDDKRSFEFFDYTVNKIGNLN